MNIPLDYFKELNMKERKKAVLATAICIFAVASMILSFFDKAFWEVTAIFCISLFMITQHRTALIPKARISLVTNNFKRSFQAFGKLKEYRAWTWVLSILFFALGALAMFSLISKLIIS